MKNNLVKKFLLLIVLLLIIMLGIFFYWQQNNTKNQSKNNFIKSRTLVSTEGWKEYSTDTFSIKYPPNYIVQTKNEVFTIKEKPDQKILEGGAYIPEAWAGIEIFSSVEFECANPLACTTKDETTINKLNFYPTEWKELLLQLDGHSPTESGTAQIMLGDKQAVYRWFIDRAGLEGFPLSESNLYIKLDNTHILPIRGEIRRDAEKNLAIIETIYSTIVFQK